MQKKKAEIIKKKQEQHYDGSCDSMSQRRIRVKHESGFVLKVARNVNNFKAFPHRRKKEIPHWIIIAQKLFV